jgi:hypothetical protein
METALAIERTPALIAAEINSIKSQTRMMVLCNSIEIGRRLVEAKSMLEHGEWGKWLSESVDYSIRTAQNLMKIFEEYGSNQISLFGDNAKTQALAHLSYTQAVALLGVPGEDREKFIEDNDIENMSTRELQQAIKERDEALRKMKIAQDVATEKNDLALQLADEKSTLEANARTTDKVLRDTQADVKMLQDALQKERDDSKAEIKTLQQSMADTKKQLSEAQSSGNSDEVKRLQESLDITDSELKISYEKIEKLEQQLKDKPIDVPATTVIDKIPEEVEKELAELRKNQSGAAALKFKVYFDELVKGFQTLLGSLAEIKEPEEQERYKKAVLGLIGKMSERLVK